MGSFQLRLKRASRLPAYSRQYIKGDPVHLIDRSTCSQRSIDRARGNGEASSTVGICIDLGDLMFWPENPLPKVE